MRQNRSIDDTSDAERTGGKLAIIFARVSTPDQDDADSTSLDTQLAACRDYADAHGLVVWRDVREVWTGAEFWERPDLMAALNDLRAGRAQHLIAYTHDRLSRSEPHHLLVLLEQAEKAGARLHFTQERLEDTAEGRFLLYARGFVAQVERAKIVERTTRAKLARIASGKLVGQGSALYGYTSVDKATGRRDIRPEQAEVVRDIFAWVAHEGVSLSAVLRRLDAAGIPTPRLGKRWRKSTLIRILREPSYRGDTFALRFERKPRNDGSGKKRTVERDPSLWKAMPDGTTPAIVSAEVWDRANARLTSNTGEHHRNQHRYYLLRGLVRCDFDGCGLPMYATSSHGRRYYRCASMARGQACGAPRVRADTLEEAVWTQYARRASQSDPEMLAADLSADQLQALDTEQHDLERRIARIEREQRRLATAMRDALSSRARHLLDEDLERSEVERASLLERLADTRRRHAEIVADTDRRHRVEVFLAADPLRDQLAHLSDPAQRRARLERVGACVRFDTSGETFRMDWDFRPTVASAEPQHRIMLGALPGSQPEYEFVGVASDTAASSSRQRDTARVHLTFVGSLVERAA
jgi:site-specific DNA recombinase